MLKIGFITPPLSGHQIRGTGIYAGNLFRILSENRKISVKKTSIKDNNSSFDLLHFPYFDPFFLTIPFVNKKPYIITVHDLVPLKMSDMFPVGIKGNIKWKIQKYLLRNSAAILTDPKASKEDIKDICAIDEDKIHVVYLGVDGEFRIINDRKRLKAIRNKFGWPKNFLLYIGDVNKNKNLVNLLKAYKIIRKQIKDLKIVFAGSGFKNNSSELRGLTDYANEIGIDKDLFISGYLEKDSLVALYNLASIYVQPSLAEGFGLPILEAMRCGCPVVCSDRSSLPEVAGEAASYVNPYDEVSIAKGVEKILADEKYKKELIKKGSEQVEKFSWERCAEETVRVYMRIKNQEL